MEQISKWCGKVYQSSGYNCCSLTVVKYSDITNLIIPFFEKYPVLGVKQKDFSDWCKVAKLMKEGSHLTEEGLKLIQSLKKGSVNESRTKFRIIINRKINLIAMPGEEAWKGSAVRRLKGYVSWV
jgi:hypothetical protein